MRLIHYSKERFNLEPREYPENPHWKVKPGGLWVSVEGNQDWKSWCEDESFMLESLAFSYEVKLKKDAKILYLKTEDEVFGLCKEYPYLKDQWNTPEGRRICSSYEIDWLKIKSLYQGIIISPYQWNCRLSLESNWYYGWDCASGCIWDLNCIEEFKFIEDVENGTN